MTPGKQIEEYERPFNVVYGEDGGDAAVIPGPEGDDFPVWKARRYAVAVIQAQVEKLPEGDERDALDKIRREFHLAQTGDLVFGMIRRWMNRNGHKRFIGITPKGTDYRDAGKSPVAPASTRHFPHQSEFAPPRQASKPKAPAMSEAERIADRMAKAARKAVEDQ
jgi:hypothetical protein